LSQFVVRAANRVGTSARGYLARNCPKALRFDGRAATGRLGGSPGAPQLRHSDLGPSAM